MKKVILILMVLLLVAPVYSLADYIVTDIGKCYSNMQVRVTGTNVTEGTYKIKSCKLVNTMPHIWNCQCSGESNKVILQVEDNIDTVYDIFVQYYIGNPNDGGTLDYQRTKTFNNVEVGVLKKEETEFQFPDLDAGTSTIIIFVVIILAIVIFVILILKRMFFGGEDIERKEEDYTDEEMLEWIEQIKTE